MTGHVYLNQDGVKEIGGFQPASYTTTAADATANSQTITLKDLPAVELHLVQIYRAGVLQNIAGVTVTTSGQSITIADGGTYAATAGDVVHLMVAGKLAE